MLKSYGWVVVVVAWSNLVSAQGLLVLGLGLKGLGLRVWGQGLTKLTMENILKSFKVEAIFYLLKMTFCDEVH